jgi:hypothetical protein
MKWSLLLLFPISILTRSLKSMNLFTFVSLLSRLTFSISVQSSATSSSSFISCLFPWSQRPCSSLQHFYIFHKWRKYTKHVRARIQQECAGGSAPAKLQLYYPPPPPWDSRFSRLWIETSNLKMEASDSSESLLFIYQTTRLHITEDRNLVTPSYELSRRNIL